MKQKINLPVAAVIIVIVALLVCGGLYRQFMYQPTYTAEDIAAKYKAAASRTQAPPSMQPAKQNQASQNQNK